jgi:hypothetical protein
MCARTISLALMVLAALPAAAADQPADGPDRGAPRALPPGSIARQIQLRAALMADAQGTTLSAMLGRNVERWQNELTPDEREQLRQRSRLFFEKSTAEQAKLFERYIDQWIAMAAARKAKYRRMNRWLKAVVASLSPERRRAVMAMTPAERARVLIEKRDQMVRDGLLRLEAPTTAPAEPASRPAAPTSRPAAATSRPAAEPAIWPADPPASQPAEA